MNDTNRILPAGTPCDIEMPPPCGLVIFGASGDLTKRKLMPALFHLFISGMLPDRFFILGVGRDASDTDRYRENMRLAVMNAWPGKVEQKAWDDFSGRLEYRTLDYQNPASYIPGLRDPLLRLEQQHGVKGVRIFYLAVPPGVFEAIVTNLGAAGLAQEGESQTRIVIEKPFGHDLESARTLDRIVRNHFQEDQIYRIDHYLAKETVQNILMFRFANSIFEPLWDRRYIDHVQITASETLGVEHRAGYYEQAGVIRDMFQNHVFQLLAITAMEPPSAFRDDRVRDEKVKVFRSIRPFPLDRLEECIAVGQYGRGLPGNESIAAYREERGVSPGSVTPTFAAMKVFIDNWRWNGVPFYLRSGKRLAERKTEIAIGFRQVPHFMFPPSVGSVEPSVLVLRIQPTEGMTLSLQAKRPGSKVCLDPVELNFTYSRGVHLDAYEWVLLDCMLSDHMLFIRQDGVDETWRLLTPVIERLEELASSSGRIPIYPAGSDGPEEAGRLLEKDGRTWRPCESP